MHNALLDQRASEADDLSPSPVFLVSVAEGRLFWRDLRTVPSATQRPRRAYRQTITMALVTSSSPR